jgi:predicted esterase
MRITPVVLIILVLFASAALADIIHMKDGTKIEGEVVAESEDSITVRSQNGTVELAKSRIERIEKKKLPQEVYKEKVASIVANDAEGHYLLALWCKEKGLEEEYATELRKVIEINPDHAAARRRLGYKRERGKWIKEGGEPKPATPDITGALQIIKKALAASNKERVKLIEKLRGFDGLSKDDFGKCTEAIGKWRSYSNSEAGETTRTFDKSKLTCLISIPEAYDGKKPTPVIVTLHGSGQTPADMMAAWKASDAAVRIAKSFIVVAPRGDSTRWWEPQNRNKLEKLLNDIKTAYNVDTNRMCLSGYENGAHGAWYFGLRNPDVFAAIAPDSGLPLNTNADRMDLDSLQNALNLPVYIMNSENDKIAPGARVGLVATKLKEYGCASIKHDEFPGSARIHAGDSWGKVCEWFQGKSRNLHPKRVQISFDGTGPARAYWLELIKPETGAKASARVEQHGPIEITVSKAKGVIVYLSDGILNLDGKVTVRINNKRVFRDRVKRSAATALQTCLSRNDRYATYACKMTFNLEEAAEK